MDSQNYYEMLGLPIDASTQDIRKAYRKAVMQFHPDLQQDLMDDNQIIKELNLAAETLLDPERRRNYDLTLQVTEPPIEDTFDGGDYTDHRELSSHRSSLHRASNKHPWSGQEVTGDEPAFVKWFFGTLENFLFGNQPTRVRIKRRRNAVLTSMIRLLVLVLVLFILALMSNILLK